MFVKILFLTLSIAMAFNPDKPIDPKYIVGDVKNLPSNLKIEKEGSSENSDDLIDEREMDKMPESIQEVFYEGWIKDIMSPLTSEEIQTLGKPSMKIFDVSDSAKK